MSERNKPNGACHDEAETPIESAATIRSRRFRDRRKRGAIVLRDIAVEPDLISALVQNGWLHESEARNREAVTAAIGGIVYQALNAGVKPAQPGRAYVPIELRAIEAAWPWARPGSQPSAESAGQAIGAAVKCARIVGFGPEVFAAHMRQMLEEREPSQGRYID
jgi:hypothetical protein